MSITSECSNATQETTKDDFSINLYIYIPQPVKNVTEAAEGLPYYKIDVTDKIREIVGENFNYDSLLGISYETPTTGGIAPIFYKSITKDLEWGINRIIEASVVNEKQKKAIKELIGQEIWNIFHHKSQTFEVAYDYTNKKNLMGHIKTINALQ